jgi:hypothetical protein
LGKHRTRRAPSRFVVLHHIARQVVEYLNLPGLSLACLLH